MEVVFQFFIPLYCYGAIVVLGDFGGQVGHFVVVGSEMDQEDLD